MTKAYRLKSSAGPERPVGTIVYERSSHDYGLANDDTRRTGIEHISVTLNPDGSPPGFTFPVSGLEPI